MFSPCAFIPFALPVGASLLAVELTGDCEDAYWIWPNGEVRILNKRNMDVIIDNTLNCVILKVVCMTISC